VFTPHAEGIVQVHPSVLCNLRCRHCYSVSGPEQRTTLPVGSILACLEDCAALGYRVVAVSGGEPFLYPDLPRLLRGARELGLTTTVTTNGTLLTRRRLESVREDLDMLAVSLDGPPVVHDCIRGAPRAFARLEAGLAEVRRLELPFGLIYTVSETSWRHIAWAGEFAHAQAAALLQLHALELVGRANAELADEYPGQEILLRAYLLAAGLRALYRDVLTVQIDLLHRDAEPALSCQPSHPGVLCLEEDGTLVPAGYGMSRRFAIGNICQERVLASWPGFLATRQPAFAILCRDVWDRFQASDQQLINWYEAVLAEGNAARHKIPQEERT
jgi:MoaA/NifB/PqqE/SkfB family radical SAM enzyme